MLSGRGLPSYQVASSSIQPSEHNRHGPKIGAEGSAPFLERGSWVGLHLTQCRLSRGLPPQQVASYPSSRLGTIDMGRKWEGLCPLFGRGAGSSSNTMCPGPRRTFVPSFILIRPTVWPQYTNDTDRTGQDRQTNNGPIVQGERFTNGRPKILHNVGKTLTDLQISACELHLNVFGGLALPGPAGDVIALLRSHSQPL